MWGSNVNKQLNFALYICCDAICQVNFFFSSYLDIAFIALILTKTNKGVLIMAHKVKIYTLSTCSHCKAVKKLLNDCGIKFKSTDVDLLEGSERENILREIVRYNPQRSFPTIVIGDKIIIGFREADIRKALGI